MASALDTSSRLVHLEQVLAETARANPNAGAASAAEVHLGSVAIERIRLLSVELQARGEERFDEVDSLTMRLLLNEYATALLHLRAVARLAASRVDAAAGPMKEARRAIHRQTKTMVGPLPNWLEKAPNAASTD